MSGRRAREHRRVALRGALTGMDGGDRLRVALDSIRSLPDVEALDIGLVVVDNGTKGPDVLDTRGCEGGWVWEGLLPAGVIAALTDLDDPSPETLLDNGFDVVHQLGIHGQVGVGAEIPFSVHFHPRLGLRQPAPFRVRFNGTEFERVEAP